MQVNRRYRFASGQETGPVGSMPVGPSPRLFFDRSHPLASVAEARCVGAGHVGPGLRVVACGACWEAAIRDDERIVVEEDLPREAPVDPGLVDEVAVERACAGDRSVRLSRVEVAAAVGVLAARGVGVTEIGRLLGSESTAARHLHAARLNAGRGLWGGEAA